MKSRVIYSTANQPMWVGGGVEIPTWHIGRQAVSVATAVKSVADPRKILNVSNEFLEKFSPAFSAWACDQFAAEVESVMHQLETGKPVTGREFEW